MNAGDESSAKSNRRRFTISDLNELLVASGDEAREITDQAAPNREKANYLKLADGQSLRGYLVVGVTETEVNGEPKYSTNFSMYRQHGDFNRKISSHACTDPFASKEGRPSKCLSCQHDVSANNVTIVVFYDIDEQDEKKRLKVFEAKKGHMKSIYGFIDLYGLDAPTTPIYFTRTGVKTDTKYTITPAPPNALKGKDASKWARPEGLESQVTTEFIMGVVNPPSEAYVRKLLGLDGNAAADTSAQPVTDEQGVSDDKLPF